jgi:hypothetical protein
MKISDYEERFQRPAPSWHQILTVNQSPNRTRRRRRRCLVAAALTAVVTLTMEVGSHHAAHSHAGNGFARERAFDVLPGALWRILDRIADSWRGGGPPQTARLKEPLGQADR